ncbi:hypothetical protein ACFO0A_01800 [Novosphingobium tardum]|uniref:AcrB/AcrD/AcrF family protein n=1 Tax=Novosphingobium tardum TaxID=1538021 RepID=A0ABV8RNG5_9SPHN
MIIGDRRRPMFDAVILHRVVLVWLVLCVVLLATNAGAIWQTRFPDGDDTLRLVEVRDWLAGQSWFDVHQYRIFAPLGVAMHWSRLVDVPIAAIIVVLTPLFGQSFAETAALVTVPLLTLGCVMLLVGRLAWKLFDEEIAGLACLACALAVPVVQQLRPMRIDHHGWQIVAMLVALNGLMARDARRGGYAIGTALAVWLAISIEGLPMAVAFVAITALKWLRNRADRAWMVNTMQSLALTSAALFLLTRGVGDLSQHCDAISPVHLAIFAWGAVVVTIVAAMEPHPRAFTLAGMALSAAGGLVIVHQAAPQCMGGAFVAIDPVVRAYWYEGVAEGLPVWHQSLSEALQMLVPPVLGLIIALGRFGASRDWLRRWWLDYAILLFAATMVAMFVARAAGVACVIAALPIGYQLREWIRSARNMRRPGRRALALAGVALALAPALPVYVLMAATPGQAAAASPAGASAARESSPPPAHVANCVMDTAALDTLAPTRILAPLDVGPRLLYATHHSVLATAHHRAAPAMRDVIDAFRGDERQARAIMARRGLTLIALCPDIAESRLYAGSAPHGMMARLIGGAAPAWLERVRLGNGDLMVWRIVG